MTKKNQTNLRAQKRMILIFAAVALMFSGLAFRIGWIQVIASDKYGKMATERQTRDLIIPAKRGVIFDRNMKELAISAASCRIFVRPADVYSGKTEEARQVKREKAVMMLSEVLELDMEEVRQMVTQDKARVRVARDVEKETADLLKARIAEEKLTGIELEEDTRRYYPMGPFMAHVLGSVNDDGHGLFGLEMQYDQYLSGVAGRWVKNTDGTGDSLSYGMEKHYEEVNGMNLVLTLDETIQHYVEKALDNVQATTAARRVMCIVMDPKTGDILAMAMTPDFDPNDPRTPLDPDTAAWLSALTDEERMDYWNQVWKNPMIQETYEPGSTFKLLTAAAALEERVTYPNDNFYCNGFYHVGSIRLQCWRSYDPHGAQTLTQGVGNSCNPVMIRLVERLGYDKLLQYFDLFGITERTGIDFPGEARPLIQSRDTAGQVGLATMSFGQGINMTPLQLITAVSVIGNEGKLMQPRLVKALTDRDGKVIESFEPQVVRQVLSDKTAAEMCDIMEYVVGESGGKVAQVPGYRIGGKTGTAEKNINGNYKTGRVVGSMVALAPMEDPRVAVLLLVDEPQGVKFGSTTAGPGVKEILSEVLRYLNVQPNHTQAELAEMAKAQVIVPNMVGRTYSDAAGLALGSGLTYTTSPAQTEQEDFVVVDQYPKPGVRVDPGELVCLYSR